MKTTRPLTICAFALLMGNSPTSAWGPDGHHMVARLAVAALPADMPAFFLKETERLMFLNFEPDVWRDPEEEGLSSALRRGHDPDHHFHLELFSPPTLPPDRYAFLKVLDREAKDAASVGVLPYRAMELFQRMRVGFRQWRSAPDQQTRAFVEARIARVAKLNVAYQDLQNRYLHFWGVIPIQRTSQGDLGSYACSR